MVTSFLRFGAELVLALVVLGVAGLVHLAAVLVRGLNAVLRVTHDGHAGPP